eukprot:1137329-Pelagomonas_calceolata.AAC.2
MTSAGLLNLSRAELTPSKLVAGQVRTLLSHPGLSDYNWGTVSHVVAVCSFTPGVAPPNVQARVGDAAVHAGGWGGGHLARPLRPCRSAGAPGNVRAAACCAAGAGAGVVATIYTVWVLHNLVAQLGGSIGSMLSSKPRRWPVPFEGALCVCVSLGVVPTRVCLCDQAAAHACSPQPSIPEGRWACCHHWKLAYDTNMAQQADAQAGFPQPAIYGIGLSAAPPQPPSCPQQAAAHAGGPQPALYKADLAATPASDPPLSLHACTPVPVCRRSKQLLRQEAHSQPSTELAWLLHQPQTPPCLCNALRTLCAPFLPPSLLQMRCRSSCPCRCAVRMGPGSRKGKKYKSNEPPPASLHSFRGWKWGSLGGGQTGYEGLHGLHWQKSPAVQVPKFWHVHARHLLNGCKGRKVRDVLG